jgi:F0F1-type ATP synthase membrane subunit b/b'
VRDIVEYFRNEGRIEVLKEANLMVAAARKKAEKKIKKAKKKTKKAHEIIIVLAEIIEEPKRRSEILSLHGFTDEEFQAAVAAIKSKVSSK